MAGGVPRASHAPPYHEQARASRPRAGDPKSALQLEITILGRSLWTPPHSGVGGARPDPSDPGRCAPPAARPAAGVPGAGS